MFKLFHKRAFFLMGILIIVLSAMVVPLAAQTSIATDFGEIYEEVSPSVVSISVTKMAGQQSAFGQPGAEQVGGGTGFVIDADGNIVTNFHVVENASEIVVEFRDGTLARAEIVGLDPDSDLAVIRVDVDVNTLQPVSFGDSDALRVGQPVIAIGSPFGENWTLTSGIVSAIDRTIQGLSQFSIGGVIQTDAAINPGNSGGPLLNMNGEVIGVNSQIISRSGSNSGIGFAIPSNLTQRVAQELIEFGYIDYSYLGISGGNVTLDVIEAFNLPNNTRGVVVGEAVSGAPADRAGLQSLTTTTNDSGETVPAQADIITAIDGTPIGSIEALITYLARNTRPGDTITLDVLRNGTETIQLDVRLTPRP